MACGLLSCDMRTLSCGLWDLVPRPGIEPRPPALGARSLTHWTTREVLIIVVIVANIIEFLPHTKHCRTKGVRWVSLSLVPELNCLTVLLSSQIHQLSGESFKVISQKPNKRVGFCLIV